VEKRCQVNVGVWRVGGSNSSGKNGEAPTTANVGQLRTSGAAMPSTNYGKTLAGIWLPESDIARNGETSQGRVAGKLLICDMVR